MVVNLHLCSDILQCSLLNPKSIRARLQRLLHSRLPFLVAVPVFLPFLQLPLVQELIPSLLRGKVIDLFLRGLWSLFFGLDSEQSAYLKLGPYKVGILGLISDGPPWPSFDDAFDEVRVVSSSDKYLDLPIVLLNIGNHKSIGVCHFPHKISVVVQLVRGLELLWSFQHDIPSF